MDNFNIEWKIFLKSFLTYFYELVRFDFSVTNPVFWLFFLVLLLILLRSWKVKKAFSFCFVIAVILLVASRIEKHVMVFFRKSAGSFDPILIRISCVIFILVVSLYYFFMKGNDD
ncbi:MAG: hypothetical protein WC330_04045 [Candidatus Omnitrophota bacterium]